MRSPLVPSYCLISAILFMIMTGCGAKEIVVSPEAPKVTIMHPEQRELSDHEEFNGWMAADKTVEVRARVRGHIMSVNFTDGQFVKKGDLLFVLDPRPFEAEVGKATDRIKIYEAQLKAAERDTDRYRELVPQRAASQKELDKAEA